MLNATALYIPTFVVLLGLVLNWFNTTATRNEFRSEFNVLRGESNGLRGEFNSLRGELNMFRGEMTTLRTDLMGELAQVKDSNHKDALEIMRQMTALHERVAVVESKQAS